MPPRFAKRRKLSAAALTPPAEQPATVVDTSDKNFLIDKHRYTKGRIVPNRQTQQSFEASDPPLCLRYGSHYIRTTFLLDRSALRQRCSREEAALLKMYDELCQQYYDAVDWQINESAFQSCRLSKNDEMIARRRRRSTENRYQLPEDSPTTRSDDKQIRCDAHVQNRGRKRVLVAFSGGISSMSALWHCLEQDYDVVLCYACGALVRSADAKQNAREIECLLRILQYARKNDGTLLFDCLAEPGSGVRTLSRQQILQRIRIVEVPQTSYVLPAQADNIPIWQTAINAEGLRMKAHPQSYLLLYRTLLNVAQSMRCDTLCLGLYGDAVRLLRAAETFWSAKVYKHKLLVPFSTRIEAMSSFQHAALRSWQVWKGYFEKKETGVEMDTGSVWRTAGPALMPNAAHYVSTCTVENDGDHTNAENVLLTAQKLALERIECIMKQEAEEELRKIDNAAIKGIEMRKKRAVEPYQHPLFLQTVLEEKAKLLCGRELDNIVPFHFCNDCLDCRPWRNCNVESCRKNDDSKLLCWQNLAAEYIQRLMDAQSRTQVNQRALIKVAGSAESDSASSQTKKRKRDESSTPSTDASSKVVEDLSIEARKSKTAVDEDDFDDDFDEDHEEEDDDDDKEESQDEDTQNANDDEEADPEDEVCNDDHVHMDDEEDEEDDAAIDDDDDNDINSHEETEDAADDDSDFY